MCICTYTLAKSRKKIQIEDFPSPPPPSYFYFVFTSDELLCMGRGQGFFFSFSFSVFFSFSLFVSFKGNYSPGPFQLSKVTKGNPTYSLPYPHTRLCFQQKQPLLGGSSFHKDPSSSHKLQMLLYLISG